MGPPPDPNTVMPGLVPGIHAFFCGQGVDGRDKPGHDDREKPRNAALS
jgi:hypothetical protein